jgi:hypothetical protein
MSGAPMTPPQDLFRELPELGNLLFCMLAGPDVTVKSWAAYYLAYAHIDRLCHEHSQATGYLARGFIGAAGMVDRRAIEGINACLTRLDTQFRALVDLLVRVECRAQVDYGAPELKRLVSLHFSPTSPWYLASEQHYCSGRVFADGLVLRRTCVPLDPLPDAAVMAAQGQDLVHRQTFGLGSQRSRGLLVRTARQVQTRLNQVYAALGAFFVARCPSVTELLHPSAIR